VGINPWKLNIGLELRPWIFRYWVNESGIAAFRGGPFTSEQYDFVSISDCSVVFKPDKFTITDIVEFGPNIIIFSILLSKINFMKVTEDTFINIITAMHIHMIAMNNSGMIGSIGNVFTGNLDFGPSGVKMVEIVSFDSKRLSLCGSEVLALVGRTACLHLIGKNVYLIVKLWSFYLLAWFLWFVTI
jgi:hypothetical protein